MGDLTEKITLWDKLKAATLNSTSCLHHYPQDEGVLRNALPGDPNSNRVPQNRIVEQELYP